MHIILVRPNYPSHLITPPLGLGYLSSYLSNEGHTTEIIDGLNSGFDNKEIVSRCSSADVVGISIMSSYITRACELVDLLKQDGKTVIIGGPHVTALRGKSLDEMPADYAVCGEGEKSLSALICSLANKRNENIPGVINRNSRDDFIKGGFIENLDSLPFPDWNKINPRYYKKAPHGGLIKNFPVAPVTTTRGCPYECSFCASPMLWDRKIRFRSPENTVAEIEYLVKVFGVKEIHFEDDNLTLKKEHIKGICELILEKKLKISWATPNGVRADTLSKDMLKLMKKSGCYYLAFGIESGNERILQNINKRTNLGAIQNAIDLARREGLMTQGFFIFGLPGETTETINRTINFAKESNLDRAQFLLLDVIPGSSLWDKISSQRCVDLHSANSYRDVTWVPDGLDKEILFSAQSRAFREFFMRPRQLFKLIRYFKPSQISFVWQRISDFNVFNRKRTGVS